MMIFLKTTIFMILMSNFFVNSLHADNIQYKGNMKILTTSGSACGSVTAKSYRLNLIVNYQNSGEISGFFEGEGITLGKFSGHDPLALSVTYPYYDSERSTGHTLTLTENNNESVSAILHDRHVAKDVDECNFDHAVMTLKKLSNEQVELKLTEFSSRYDAQLARSEAIDLTRKGQLYEAVLRYEKGLKLIELVYPLGSSQRDSYTIALAGSYIKSGMVDEFNKLYDQLIISIKDEATRAVFNAYKIRILQATGRLALNKEDFDTALKSFQKAYILNPQDKNTIAGVMSSYMRKERYDEAVEFLENVKKTMQSNEERRDLASATGMVLYKKSLQLDKERKNKEAEQALKRAIDIDVDGYVFYMVALARLRHKNGTLSEAEKMLQQLETRYKDLTSKKLISIGREKMRQIDAILKKINSAGS